MMLERRLFTLAQLVRGYVTGNVFIGVLISATYIGQGIALTQCITLILDRAAWEAILLPLGVALLLSLVRAVLLWLREVCAKATAAAVKQRLRRQLYQRLLELGPGYLERTSTGTVQATMVDGVEALEGYLGYYLPQALVTLIVPFVILAYIAMLDPLIALCALACLVLAPLAPRLWDGLLRNYGEQQWMAYVALNAQFLDSMQGMATLKAFNASRARGEQLHQQAVALYRATMAQLAVSMVRNGIVGLAMSAGSALAVGLGAVRLTQGALSVPELLLLLFLARECFRPLNDLNAYWHLGYMGLATSTGIFALLDATPEVQEPTQSPGELRVASKPRIAFEQVAFAYQGGERPALHDLSLVIEPGATVALVGPSGAGKSTAVALLLRFFDPQQGRITLDGQDLKTYPLAQLRRSVAVVTQETYLFHGSVAANLRMAKPQATQAELEQVARAANAHEFITRLPAGYETVLGERGLKLSGGERQRLAIARALLKDAPILVLDEATSSVDAATEHAIQEALARLTAQRTTLVIAHRLSTIAQADRIVVLENGRVVEAGSHHALLAASGAYARLIHAQQSVG